VSLNIAEIILDFNSYKSRKFGSFVKFIWLSIESDKYVLCILKSVFTYTDYHLINMCGLTVYRSAVVTRKYIGMT